MKKIIITILATITIQLGFSQVKVVKSEIEKATVFKNGAQITRSAKTNLKVGKSVIIFDNLSLNINSESILVTGKGNFTILSVANNIVTANINKIDEDEIAKLNQLSDNLKDTLNYEQSKLDIYESQIDLLSKLENKYDEVEEFSLADFKDAIEFQNKKLTEIKFKQFNSKTRIIRVKEEINEIKSLVNIQKQQKTITKKQIVVTVSSKVAVVANLKIGYYINNAGWTSSYDIRVKDISKPVELIHKANVYQNTGEDWNEVLLTLSNGNPMQSGIKPNLQSWYINYTTPNVFKKLVGIKKAKQISGVVCDTRGEPIPGANIVIPGTSTGTVADLNGRFSILAPKGSKAIIISFVGCKPKTVSLSKSKFSIKLEKQKTGLEEVVVTALGVSREKKALGYSASYVVPVKTYNHQTTVEFEIDLPYTIPSDGKKYSVQIQELEFPSKYQYYCVPKLDKDAFLIAKITNWEETNISGGSANLYFEGTYLGKTNLNLNGIKDTMFLSLGRDKNIKVERSKIKDQTTDKFLGNKKTEEKGWKISIKNLKNQPIDLVIEDQIPLSTIEEIEVEALDLNYGLLDKESGKIKWLIKLPTKKDKTIYFKYSIKYPDDYKITADN